MESAERISKALDEIGDFMESARKTAQAYVGRIVQAEEVKKTIENAVELKASPPNGCNEAIDEDSMMTLTIELLKLGLEKIEQLIESMREIQKILFSTRNKRIEEAIKYIEQVCDKSDNNFDNQLLLKKPKYMQWFMQTEYGPGLQEKLKTMDLDSNKMNVTTEMTPKESLGDAYKILTLVFHPDKGGDTERFKIINNAYDILKDVDIELQPIFIIFRIAFLVLIYQSQHVNKFSNIQKILAEKS